MVAFRKYKQIILWTVTIRVDRHWKMRSIFLRRGGGPGSGFTFVTLKGYWNSGFICTSTIFNNFRSRMFLFLLYLLLSGSLHLPNRVVREKIMQFVLFELFLISSLRAAAVTISGLLMLMLLSDNTVYSWWIWLWKKNVMQFVLFELFSQNSPSCSIKES